MNAPKHWLHAYELPPQWTVVQLRNLGRVRNGGTPRSSDQHAWGGDVPFVTPPDLSVAEGGIIEDTERTLTRAGALASGGAPPGSVVVSTRAPIDSIGRVSKRSAFNQGCRAVIPDAAVDVRFLVYSLIAAKPEMSARGQGTTFLELSSGAFSALPLPSAPPDKQRLIADFVDRETAQIDALIAKQNTFIALLQERRRAVADTVVWTGLRDNAAVSPTGVRRAPDSPSHWQRRRNKHLFSERAHLSRTGREELLTVSHLTGVTPRSEKNVTMFEAESTVGYKRVCPGDLAINTMWAWMGALGISSRDGIVSPSYGVYRPLPGQAYHPRYFDYLYRSSAYVTEMTRYSRGITSSRLRLYPEVFLRLGIVVPPIEEQEEIADHLDEQTARIDALIVKTREHIALAKERRNALITEAVTGRLNPEETN